MAEWIDETLLSVWPVERRRYVKFHHQEDEAIVGLDVERGNPRDYSYVMHCNKQVVQMSPFSPGIEHLVLLTPYR